MAICITFGMDDFSSRLKGYEDVVAYCYNCHNWSGRCVNRWPWITICFIPVIPLSFHKYQKVKPIEIDRADNIQEVTCYTCRFTQDLRDRPDITPATRPPQFPQYYMMPGVPLGHGMPPGSFQPAPIPPPHPPPPAYAFGGLQGEGQPAAK